MTPKQLNAMAKAMRNAKTSTHYDDSESFKIAAWTANNLIDAFAAALDVAAEVERGVYEDSD